MNISGPSTRFALAIKQHFLIPSPQSLGTSALKSLRGLFSNYFFAFAVIDLTSFGATSDDGWRSQEAHRKVSNWGGLHGHLHLFRSLTLLVNDP